MTAQLFLIIPSERAWIRAPYPNTPAHVAELKRQIAAIREDEAQRIALIRDLQRESVEATRWKCKLQTELYRAEAAVREDCTPGCYTS